MAHSRLTNEQLDLMGKTLRRNASEESTMSWPVNSEFYRDTQIAMAEVYEELLSWRLRAQ